MPITAATREPARSKYPPGPEKPVSILNFIKHRHRLLGIFTRFAADYGDITHFRSGRRHFYFINHPDYIRDVLVTHARHMHKSWALQNARRILGEGLLTSEDNFHLRQRRLAQPAFQRQRIQEYAGCMLSQAAKLSARWRDGQQIDAHAEMMRLALLIAAESLFGADVESEAPKISEALSSFMRLFGLSFVPFAELLERLPIPAMTRFRRSLAELDGLIYRMIEARRSDPRKSERNDLLSLLLRAQDEETGGRMTDRQLRDECVTLLLAGHETTANTLTMAWYLLASHPDAEKKLHMELETLRGDREPVLSDLQNLRYTESVLAETMRLYPPAWVIGREATDDFELGGYKIPRGSTLLMSQWVMHRDRRYWSDPEAFDAERWKPEIAEMRAKYAYFPFGAGSRQCIGESFAWMESTLVLAALARQWRLHLIPGFHLELQPVITLRPRNGL
ncbi:MAG: cytochrome P450, partial [Acidobacteriales bacterium]|nr:cytochrome P450 [Terriglobales bacterium]